MKIKIIIILLTLLGGFLRFYALDKNPPSLNVDEVSIGYNAYSILKTGKDEYGASFPIFFQSLGDYKPPLYIYMAVPSIAVFGLNEIAVRFPAALFGTLSIPLFYIFFITLLGNKKYSLLATTLVSISPWHIYFSRVASESMVATFLVVLGATFLLKAVRGSWYWTLPSSFFLILSMYTYHAQRVFVPLLLLIFLLLFWNKTSNKKMKIATLLVASVILLIPFVFSILTGEGNKRAAMTVITNDPVFHRNFLIEYKDYADGLSKILSGMFSSQPVHLIFYFLRKFLAYFQPSFLFFSGLSMTNPGTFGLGIMYLFEIPFFIVGLIRIIKSGIVNEKLIYLWVLAGVLPAALTLSEEHPIRTLVAIPMVLLISGIGAVTLFELLKKTLNNFSFKIVLGIFTLFVFWNLSWALLIFTIHFPKQKAEGFMEGTKEAVEFAVANKDKYEEIIFDPNRGIQGPYITSAPHAYILFYSKYDPKAYQTQIKKNTENSYSFDKFTIRHINWSIDRGEKNKLFIGSPWSMPLVDLKDYKILKKIYLPSGDLALLIVSSN